MSEPSVNQVHHPRPLGSEEDQAAEPPGGMKAFLTKLYDLLRGKANDGELSPDEFTQAVHTARAHAGGAAAAANRQQATEVADVCAKGHSHRLFVATRLMEPPEWIPLLPKPGTYQHPEYGDIRLDPERVARFVRHVTDRVYGQDLPIDAEHETKLSGALGWIREARVNSDGSADGRVDWTPRGQTLLAGDQFRYISPEWYDTWQEPASGETYPDVLIGAALTTRPFFKDSALRPLIASERGFEVEVEIEPDAESDTEEEAEGTLPPNEEEEETVAESQFSEMEARHATELAALKQLNEQQASALKQASERIAALERTQRDTRFRALIANGGRQWFGEVDKHMQMLTEMADRLGEDSQTLKNYCDMQRGMAELAADNGLLGEIGSSGRGATPSAEEEIAGKAQQKAQADKVTYAEAYSRVLNENPSLYQRYLVEQRAASR